VGLFLTDKHGAGCLNTLAGCTLVVAELERTGQFEKLDANVFGLIFNSWDKCSADEDAMQAVAAWPTINLLPCIGQWIGHTGGLILELLKKHPGHASCHPSTRPLL
jgi:hypothetical protein